jgi:membrane peptidoglycan carboxypeptidase
MARGTTGDGMRVLHHGRREGARALVWLLAAIGLVVAGAGRALARAADWQRRASPAVGRRLRRLGRALRPHAGAPAAVTRSALRAADHVRGEAPGWADATRRATRRGTSGGRAALTLPLGRIGRELRHQYVEARELRAHTRPLHDRRGRRLRASAYLHHRRAARRGGDLRATLPVSRPRQVGTLVLTTVVLGFASFFGGSQAFIDFSAYLPDVHSLRTTPLPEDTIVTAADGTVIADLHPSGLMHYSIPLSKMGMVPAAVVAVEDANFWTEPGVDPGGIARAAWVDLQHKRAEQGASTITQQLVKLQLLKDSSQTIDRKVKEAILAVQAQHTYSRAQILEMYMNGVHFGNQSLGVQAAAQNYFRKDADQLDLAQTAMLAGIPQSPVYNDPLTNWDVAKYRQRQVLDAMVHTGMIKPRQADQAYAEDLRPILQYPPDSVRAAPAFVAWVTADLVARYGKEVTYQGGLRVTTSLNLGLQAVAEDAVRQNVNANLSKNIHQGAMVSIDPHTGEVMTMVGSLGDGPGSYYNFASAEPRNPGSSFKIFNYTAAINSTKFTMTTPIHDAPITINMPGQQPGYQPKNYDGKYHGDCPLQACMGNSLNVPAVAVEIENGVDQVVNMARQLGAPPFTRHDDGSLTQDDPPSSFGAALTLGGYGETPLQMATAAATIANMGVAHPTTGVLRVASADGTEMFRYDPVGSGRQVLDPRVAYIMQAIMSNDDNRKTVFGPNSALTIPGRTVGAKTGTTDDWRDAWTVGYTPALASAFWFGNPDYSPMQQGYDAIYAAAPAWQNYMSRALTAMGRPGTEWWAPPAGLASGGPGLWLIPGTKLGAPPPPLPPWAQYSSAPASKPEPVKPGT